MVARSVTWTGYGEQAYAVLRSLVTDIKGSDALRQVTVLVPTQHCGVITRRTLAHGVGQRRGVAGLAVLTVDRLAERLAAPTLAGSGRRPITDPVLAAAWRTALSANPGVFAEVAGHSATVVALVNAHRQLREVGADAHDAIAGSGEPIAVDLVRLHRDVAGLLGPDWYDVPDLRRAAIQALRDRPALGEEIGAVVVFLPQDLPAGAAALIHALTAAGEVRTIAALTNDARADAGVLRSLQLSNVNAPTAQAAKRRTAGRVTHASDADDEARCLVRMVTAALSAAPAHRLAVLYGSARPYARLLAEHLDAAGIRWNGSGVRPTVERTLPRALLDLLALPDHGWRRDEVLGVLSAAPVRATDGNRVPASRWERISRIAGVVADGDWDTRLKAYATQERAAADEEKNAETPRHGLINRRERDAASAEQLQDFVADLRGRLQHGASLRRWSELAGWALDTFRVLVADIDAGGWLPHDEARAADRVTRILAGLSSLDTIEPTADLAGLRLAVELALADDLQRHGRFGDGILVAPMSAAVGLDADAVFVVGLAEDLVPGRLRADPLLPDRIRALTGGALPPLRDRVDRRHRHLLAALACAGECVASFPRGDLRKSSTRLPSRWLLPTLRALSGTAALDATSWQSAAGDRITGSPSYAASLATTADLATGQEWRTRAALAARSRDGNVLAALPSDPVLGRAIAMLRARFSAELTRFDGNLAGHDVPDPTQRTAVSPTALEAWARCPHGYFMAKMLWIEPVESPEELVQISALDIGSLIHDAVDAFFTTQSQAGTVPGGATPWTAQQRADLRHAAATIAADLAARGATGHPMLWRHELGRILTDLDRLLDDDEVLRAQTGRRQVSSELVFGMRGAPVVAVGLPGGRVIGLRGSADRVDVASDGAITIVDYKTGSARSFTGLSEADATAGGTKLQLPVYAYAARAALGLPQAPVAAEYWFLRKDRGKRVQLALTPQVERAYAETLAVIADGVVALRHVAAVTFTEKAAAQLRDRLRAAFERRGATAPAGSWEATAAAQALDDLDTAAIGTLHSFAQRILAEHPIEAGLPPLVEVRDEVSSGVAFDERWAALRAELLDDPDLADVLPLALAAGVRLDDLRSMAAAFTDNWDLLADRILAAPPGALPAIDADTIVADARRLTAQAELCTEGMDKFLPRLTGLSTWAAMLAEAGDDAARLAVLADAGKLKWSYGQRRNWTCDLAQLRQQCIELAAAAGAIRDRVLDVALRRLAHRLAQATLQDAQVRRGEGRLEFHDLLVLARDLLRNPVHGPAVRAVLQQRYRRLLLDEFQDTDPIQIDLAIRIAGGAPAGSPHWTDVAVPPGSLFVVGDPKQSIYRFRRADIATYLSAQQHIGAQVVLDTNFRTGAPTVDWVNHIFAQLITAVPDSQPAYRPLRAHRPGPPTGPPVLALGADAHADNPSADDIRTREAADVAATVRAALAERWQVHDETTGGWRDVELRDIAVLVPARTSVAHLEAAFDATNIGYHSEASSLVYRTREVRDLLAAARAADDPSDPLTLVTALRSPLFGCGDDDLWTWYQAGGRWNLLAPPPDAVPPAHPVAQAIAYLRRLHDDRTWLAPSEILTRLADDRRMFELATVSARSERSEPRSRELEAGGADGKRSRDVWRRLRFVIDQARAWSDAEHAGLRAYLRWATRQGSDSARVAEAVLPETDADTLRIMTVHAAKGLEFPVVIATGMTSRPGGARSGIDVLRPRDGGCQFKLRKDLQTKDFDVAKPIDEQMGHHERLRLLYVACTRARDHLVVSLHRKARPPGQPGDDRNRTNAELLADANTGAPSVKAFTAAPPPDDPEPPRPAAVQPPPPLAAWQATMDTVRARGARPAAVSASQLEGTLKAAPPRTAATDRLGEPTDAGLAKDARDLELPPWNKGRYGTAIGRAVHGVLQTVDLTTGDGLDHAVAAQIIAEGVADHADLVTQLARSALASDVVRHAATREHWRETYVGTIVGDRVLDGVIDLLYRDHDGLVIVDYKTDAAPTAALDSRVDFYRPQMAAYALAVAAATGETVARCVLLFLSPTGAHERHIDDLTVASAQIREAVLQFSSS